MCQGARSCFIILGLRPATVNRPVDLDCYAELRAVEVHDEPADHMLPAELEAQTSPIAKQIPSCGFRCRRLAAVDFRQRDFQRTLPHLTPPNTLTMVVLVVAIPVPASIGYDPFSAHGRRNRPPSPRTL